jgi:hypothetical protein
MFCAAVALALVSPAGVQAMPILDGSGIDDTPTAAVAEPGLEADAAPDAVDRAVGARAATDLGGTSEALSFNAYYGPGAGGPVLQGETGTVQQFNDAYGPGAAGPILQSGTSGTGTELNDTYGPGAGGPVLQGETGTVQQFNDAYGPGAAGPILQSGTSDARIEFNDTYGPGAGGPVLRRGDSLSGGDSPLHPNDRGIHRPSTGELVAASSDGGGSDWGNAAVGALGGFGITLLLVGGAFVALRNRDDDDRIALP